MYIPYDFTFENFGDLGNSLFGAVKLRKNADKDKYDYSSYDVGFEARSTLTLLCGGSGKKTVIYFVSNSSLVHANNKKDILIL